jgi:predicted ATPase
LLKTADQVAAALPIVLREIVVAAAEAVEAGAAVMEATVMEATTMLEAARTAVVGSGTSQPRYRLSAGCRQSARSSDRRVARLKSPSAPAVD